MRISRERGLVLIIVLTAGLLTTALWPVATSSGRSEAKERIQLGEERILAEPEQSSKLSAAEAYGKLPLSFEVNQGQTNRRVKFLSRGAGYNLFLTSNEAVLSLHRPQVADRRKNGGKRSDVLSMKLVAAYPNAKIEGLDQLPGKSNYFIGKNPRNWRTGISTYGRVHYREIYKGVDLVYYGNQGQLENDFVVAPGADPNVIALAFDGAKKITIDKDGNLLLQTGGGQAQLQRPVVYQLADGVRQEVAGNYILKSSGEVGFEVAAYDHTRSLIIDPVLVYSSYLGGNGTEVGNAITMDNAGNAYITGSTTSSIFPTVSPMDSTLGGTEDAFIVKINPTGSAIVYSTYLGGSSTDTGIDISVDGSQNAYVTGRTASSDFPTMNAFDSTYSGGTDEDAFVVRINPAGSALVYSTYLSGNFGARGCGIWANNSQNFAYVTGTTSVNFPVTASAFEATNFNSGFLTKLCTNCSGANSLVYSTFLAHTGSAEGRAVVADVAGNAYITGNLNSTTTNFATPGAFQTTFGGGSADAFVEKFNTNLSGAAGRVYATYLGGSAKDIGGADGSLNPGKAIAIDESGNAYITGATASTNFPLSNASQGTIGGQNDAFLTKLNATGSSLIYSTYLGGTGDDFGKSIAVNIAGGAYVTGVAGPNFPTVNALPTPNPGIGFVTKFTPSGTVLYSTLLSGVSGGSFGIALDGAGNAFATGSTNASIVTVNPFQPTNGGGGTDGWVSMIADPTIVGRVNDENGNPLPGATVNLTGVPTATTTTDAKGCYTFGLLTVGNSYTVSVVVPGYIFASVAVNNLQKNVRRDFGPNIISIGGQVTLNATGLSGVTMTLGIGKSLSVQTNASGNYVFSNLPAGRTYTVMPTKNLFQFNPQSILYFQMTTDVLTANFVAIPLTVQFSSGTGSGSETPNATTKVDLVVTRTGDASAPARVDYASVDGTASERSDYLAARGTLHFAVGEASKTISVFIVDDSFGESPETFSVTLSNAVGCALGSPNTVTVTINSNETVNGPNPVKDASFNTDFFVRQHYLDFFNREPDPGGLAFWKDQIDSCTTQACRELRRINVSAAFFLSIEFQQTGYLVERLYKSAYGDATGTSTLGGSHQLSVPIVRLNEFLPDTQQIGRGVVIGAPGADQLLETNKQALIGDFVQRSRFMTAYPVSMTPTQFVSALNTNAGGVLSPAEFNQLVSDLTTGAKTRAQVLRAVAEDSDLFAAETNRAFVLAQFFGYLRRNPNDSPDSDYTGYDFWLGKLNQFNGNFVNAEMVKAFIVSGEYQGRFGP
ncbi:MAG TPA: SBBP repeat-containing protein [Pyrinomonadaceae bacterium]|nr:SBBP repeat-containing protein [Pyrinomonadaceae bacterium]